MPKLKIGFLSNGSLIHIRAYAEFFASRGHTVCWIAYSRPTLDLGVPTFDISWGLRARSRWGKWRFLLTAFSLRRLLERLDLDVLHGHYVTAAGLLCLAAGFRPFVLTAHGSDVIESMGSPFRRRLLSKTFARAACINVVSEELADCVRRLGVPDGRVLLANPGVDTQRFVFKQPREIGGPVRLLCTRALDQVHDPWTILRACEILGEHGIPFEMTFAAGGRDLECLRSAVRERGLNDRVHLLGGYANTDLPALLAAHDIYVSATWWDGTAISLLEAMAAGVYPVVSRIRSNQAWLTEGETGLMFDRENATELAERIVQASGDLESRRRAALENRACVENRGDRRKNLGRLEQALVGLAEGGRRGTG